MTFVEVLDRLIVGAMIMGVSLLWVSVILGILSTIFVKRPKTVVVLIAVVIAVVVVCYVVGGYAIANRVPIVGKYML